MEDRLKTNKDEKRTFDDYGDNYVSGIVLLKYKLNPTKNLKPANPKRTTKKTTENIAIKYAYLSNELDLSKIPSKRQSRRRTISKTSVGSTP